MHFDIRTQTTSRNKLLYAVKIFVLALIYFISGKLSFALEQSHEIVTVVIFAAEGFASGQAHIKKNIHLLRRWF